MNNLQQSRIIYNTGLFLWVGTFCLICFYIYTDINSIVSLSGSLSLIGQSGLDLFCLVLCILLYRRSTNIAHLSFAFSFFMALLADFSYNLIFNIYETNINSTYFDFAFDLPFTFFLVGQLLSWLIINSKNLGKQTVQKQITPVYITSALILIVFTIGIGWEYSWLSGFGVMHIIQTFVESNCVALCLISFARANNKSLKLLSTGLIIILCSDLAIRSQFVQYNLQPRPLFEVTWIIGLTLIASGLLQQILNKYESIDDVTSMNSIQSQIPLWMLTTALFSLFISILVFYIYAFSINPSLLQIKLNYAPSFFALLALCAVSIGTLFSNKIIKPITDLTEVVNKASNSIDNTSPYLAEGYNIIEFNELKNFIILSFKKMNAWTQKEKEYARMARQAAHDIRSPLACLSTIQQHIHSLGKEDQSAIMNSLNRIENVADYLLREHQTQLKIEASDIAPHISKIVKEKNTTLEHQDVKIHTSLPDKEAILCKINPTIFERILSNLLDNAIEAMNKKEKRINITANRLDKWVIINITDNGIGIAEKHLTFIRKGYSTKKAGYGLGLQHAKARIEEWEGNFIIHSQLNHGTTINIQLPVSDNN